MKSRHGCVLLLAGGVFLSAFCLSEGAPLLYPHTPGGGTGDTLSVSLYLSLAVSLTALVALVVLLVNCVTCCKEREINFKEFEDHFDDEIDFTPPAEDTPSMQSPAEVYTLAVSPVPLPGPPHLQPPARIAEGSTGFQVARHSLSYIQEIGNGWFGQVLLSEIYTDPGGARVVVKELKANASAKEQNDFLQQGDPYRVLQHPNILQCLGQCVEAIPFLLVFEYCEMGDLRGYLSQQDWMFRNAELLQLQRMACEIAAGVTHLHKHNFLHSDLALRNCYLTADLTVKVGDYGIGPYRYKEDYIITEDDVFAPLRWLAPELVGERHGGVITMEQTKPSNVWALGVTLWELFENAAQPYPHLSDREVLNHVIKDQQVKLFKPQLELPYSDRWYEVLQFCWLSPDKRATAEEVHRLLIYLRMQGQKDIEEDFEQRWDALKPNPSTRQTTVSHSSFPILEQFADDALRQEIDEVLTVTETSKGLSFEYVWEAAKHDHYDGSHGRSGMDTTLNYHSMFFPVSSEDIQAHFPDPVGRAAGKESGNTPSGIPGIVPVFDAQKPSNGNEYFIQLEEQGETTVGEDGNREQDMDLSSGRQDFVVLQDVRLDESSTDADFFHQSIDSKDSYLPDSHIWSSLENDSPYHTNIFTEGGSKQEDSPSWRKSFMELPERNGNPFHETAPLEVQEIDTDKSYGDSFLGDCSEAPHLSDSMEVEGDNTDVKRLLNTEKLTENFMFLKDQNLMKEGSSFSSPLDNFLLPGVAHEPEATFKMRSWDNLDTLGSLTTMDTYLKPAASSTISKQELLDSPSASLGDFRQSLVENETLVPFITVVSEDDASNQLPVRNSSSTEDLGLLQSSDRGVDSGFDSTSERFEIIISQTDDHTPEFSESATTDLLCTDAKIPSLEDDLGTSKDNVRPIDGKIPENLQVEALPSDNGLNEDLTSNDLLSELIEDADIELETTLSDHEESFMDTSGGPLVRSSLLVSGPSLDQISQDSLLEDSMSTTLPTVDNSAETPDSLDSLDIHRLGEQGEELSAQIAQHKLQPPYKISDSGYETENLESPEWNSQPNVKESPVKNGLSVAKEEDETEGATAAANLVPPEIIISEVEGVLDAHGEDPSEDRQPDLEPPAEEPVMGSNYRDSAYFSDNESESEKKSDETAAGGSGEVTWLRNSTEAAAGPSPEADVERDVDSLFSHQEPSVAAEAKADGETPDQHAVATLPEAVSTEKCEIEVTESTDDNNEGGTQTEVLGDVTSPDRPDPSQDLDTPFSSETPSTPSPESTGHAKLTRTYASDSHKIKEPDMEGRYLGRRDGSGLDGQEDGVDADEEDENSDDSDDDIRAYRLNSSSSESEDEAMHTVPLIVSDDSSAKNLKSLLKPTTLNIEASSSPFAARSGADNSKRAVSFFDDVTVYLFDQETPTKELGDHSSGSSQVPEFSSPVPTASYLNRFTNSESSTDEEGGGFEWDDDFSSPAPAFLPKTEADPVSKASSAAARFSSPPPATGRVLEPSWTSSSNYSRFSISPASIASFSLTHLTDSDIEQGGSSEDGEKD